MRKTQLNLHKIHVNPTTSLTQIIQITYSKHLVLSNLYK